MSNLPFTLPSCDQPATVRIEVFTIVPGPLQGSLDASVYTCTAHAADAVTAIETADLEAHVVPMAPDVARTCGETYVFPTGAFGDRAHPHWCDRARCERLRVHVSPVYPVDTNRPEETVLDVALMQLWEADAVPQVSLTVINGVDVQQVLMSLGQARALSYQIRRLLDVEKGGRR